jgi:hypothetical protein
MKKCPFCAEEIQDAAIKCKHCGSTLTEGPPSAALVPSRDTALDEELKRLLGAFERNAAIKLLCERNPTLGLAAATSYVDAIDRSTDAEQVVTQAPQGTKPPAGCLVVILLAVVGGYFTFCKAPGVPQSSATQNWASYAEVDAEVGCNSPYSSEKKDDLFKSRYRDHWMSWYGTVVMSSASDVSLDIDGTGLQDLEVEFADKNAGYDLQKGNRMTVLFLMKNAGGCVLPYSGREAKIVAISTR